MPITNYLVIQKAICPVLETYRVVANPKDFADETALKEHLMGQIVALRVKGKDESDAVFVEADVQPYDDDAAEFVMMKVENLAVAKANAEADVRSVSEAKKKAVELAKRMKSEKKA